MIPGQPAGFTDTVLLPPERWRADRGIRSSRAFNIRLWPEGLDRHLPDKAAGPVTFRDENRLRFTILIRLMGGSLWVSKPSAARA